MPIRNLQIADAATVGAIFNRRDSRLTSATFWRVIRFGAVWCVDRLAWSSASRNLAERPSGDGVQAPVQDLAVVMRLERLRRVGQVRQRASKIRVPALLGRSSSGLVRDRSCIGMGAWRLGTFLGRLGEATARSCADEPAPFVKQR